MLSCLVNVVIFDFGLIGFSKYILFSNGNKLSHDFVYRKKYDIFDIFLDFNSIFQPQPSVF